MVLLTVVNKKNNLDQCTISHILDILQKLFFNKNMQGKKTKNKYFVA